MIILDVAQGSDEWFQARRGIPTASCFDKIITPGGKASNQHKDYSNKLVAEFFLNDSESTWKSESMQAGTEIEPEARDYYRFITDINIIEVGLIYKDEDKLISCSPDSLADDRGLEIKCPDPHTQIEYLLNNRLPITYIPQVQGSMWVTGLKQWDFLSYHPGLPPLLLTVEADKLYHDTLDGLMVNFIENLLKKRKTIEGLNKEL